MADHDPRFVLTIRDSITALEWAGKLAEALRDECASLNCLTEYGEDCANKPTPGHETTELCAVCEHTALADAALEWLDEEPDVSGQSATDAATIARARAIWAEEGEIEIDDNAAISDSGDPEEGGVYVSAWVWVPNDDPAGEAGA